MAAMTASFLGSSLAKAVPTQGKASSALRFFGNLGHHAAIAKSTLPHVYSSRSEDTSLRLTPQPS